jgi:hypothetical protein
MYVNDRNFVSNEERMAIAEIGIETITERFGYKQKN